MTEYTTPDFVFRIKDDDVDLRNARHVYLTLQQGNYICTKDENSMEIGKNTVSVWFDQDEIAAFKSEGNRVDVQINWTYEDDGDIRVKRAATRIKSFQVTRNLLKKVIE